MMFLISGTWETGVVARKVPDPIVGARSGNFYLTLSRQQYWHTDEVERLLQLGYSNNWRQISWNLTWNYTDSINRYSSGSHSDDYTDSEHIFMFTVSLPLSGWLEGSYVNYSMTQNNHNDSSMQAGIGGTLLEGHNLAYSVQESGRIHRIIPIAAMPA